MDNSMLTKNEICSEDYETLRQFLQKNCGVVLGDNKHALVINRLQRLPGLFGVMSFKELVGQVTGAHNAQLRQAVVDAMTTHETFWFRDLYPFVYLKTLLQSLAATRRGKGEIRIWSAACSTGQEPYSIAIVVDELNQARALGDTRVRIVATDVATSVVEQAAEGVYPCLAISRGMDAQRTKRYFDKTDQGDWAIKRKIKEYVTFSPLNLMESFDALGYFDIVLLRNVLIYFDHTLKADIISRVHRVFNQSGYLFLGASESIPQNQGLFVSEYYSPGIVYRNVMS
ncbi:MAG: protein-glutamate O-methyltransferase CheR [Gammaproteobacteria bacterium]